MIDKEKLLNIVDTVNSQFNDNSFLENEEQTIETLKEIQTDIKEFTQKIKETKESETKSEEPKVNEKSSTISHIKDKVYTKGLPLLISIIVLFFLTMMGISYFTNRNKAIVNDEIIELSDLNLNDVKNDNKIDDSNKTVDEIIKENLNNDDNDIKDLNLNDIKNDNDDLQKANDEVDKMLEKNKKLEQSQSDIDKALLELSTQNNSYVNQSQVLSPIMFYKKQVNDNNKNVNSKDNNSNLNGTNILENKNKLLFETRPFILTQGSVIPAVLITEINTDLQGQVLAQVRENIYDSKTGRYLLIPKGSRIYGTYDSEIQAKQARVAIKWNTIILPNTNRINLADFTSMDKSGMTGLKDRVNNHYLDILGDAIFGTILNLGNSVVDGVTFSVGGVSVTAGGSVKNENNGNSNSPLRQATAQLLQQNVNRKPTIEIKKGYTFNILVNETVELLPYKYK